MFDKQQYMKEYNHTHAKQQRKWHLEHPVSLSKRQEYWARWKEKHPNVKRIRLPESPFLEKLHNHNRYLQKHSECQICGSTKDLMKHHCDYSRPSEITTLCRICHARIHKLYGAAKT